MHFAICSPCLKLIFLDCRQVLTNAALIELKSWVFYVIGRSTKSDATHNVVSLFVDSRP